MAETIDEILPDIVVRLLPLSDLLEEMMACLHELREPEINIFEVAVARRGASEVAYQSLCDRLSILRIYTRRQVLLKQFQQIHKLIRTNTCLGRRLIIKKPRVTFRVL